MITEDDIPDLPDDEAVYVIKIINPMNDYENDAEYLMLDGTLQKSFWHASGKYTLVNDIRSGLYTFVGIGYRHSQIINIRWML